MTRNRALLCVVTLALSAVMLMAADEAPIVINDFSLGLNTTQKPTKMVPGEAVIAHEVDLTKNPGGLTVRNGYDLAITAYGNDSILTNGLFVYNKLGGKRQLMMVADSTGSPYANLYASPDNSIAFVFGSSSEPDTFWCIPDVDWNDSVAAARSEGSYHAGLAVFSGASSQNWSAVFDTATTAAEIVDSIVANLNGAFSMTVSDNGDTAIFAEATNDDDLSVVAWPYANPFNSGWVGKWTITLTSPDMSRVATRLPAGGGVVSVEHQGAIYVLNSVAPGVIYDGAHAQRFPVKPPGGINALPVRIDSTGFGPARYRYAVQFMGQEVSSAESTVVNVLSCLSDEIEVCDSCDVLLSGFPRPAKDQWHSADTISMEIWRTTAIDNVFGPGDTLWYTGANVKMWKTSYYNAAEYLDTATDSALRALDSFVVWGEEGFEAVRIDTVDDDSTRKYTYYHKPGSPVLLSADTAVDSFGVWTGIADSLQIAAGWSWFIVRYDTILGIYSDSGRSLNIYQAAKPDSFAAYTSTATDTTRLAFARADAEQFQLVLPMAEDSGIVYMLYRAPIVPFGYDTLTFYSRDSVGVEFYGPGPGTYPNGSKFRTIYESRTKSTIAGKEFFARDYRLIGQFVPGDTVVDSIWYDKLLTRTPYQRNRAPSRVRAALSYNDQLLLADEHNVYYSVIYDTVTLYNALNQLPLGDASDGDITDLWAERGYIKAAKTKATFNLYNHREFFGVEKAAHYGNVSSHSAVQAPEGTYVLSNDEVRLISEGVFRDRSIADPNIAGHLDNFSKLSASVKSKAFGTYFDNKYLLTIGDTTYVANKVRGRDGYQLGWTTWGFPISAAALYRAGDDLSDVADTLYFSKPGGIQVYRLSGAVTDAATDGTTIPIDWQWRSGAFPGAGWSLWQPTEMLFNVYSTDTTSANLVIDLYNANDSLMAASQQALGRIDTANIYRFELGTIPESPYWYIDLYTTNPIGKAPPPNAETAVEGIQIRMIRRGDI